jgi:integrase
MLEDLLFPYIGSRPITALTPPELLEVFRRLERRAAITEPRQVAQLLRAIDGYQGHFAVETALQFAPLVFVRPGELRAAEWSEFDLDVAEWRIAAHRTKMRRMHIVPLARQAIALLREIHPRTGRGRFVFPSRRMGYTGAEMSWHGFRAMASTLLNEQGYSPDVIELQLAHQERNEVRAAYNRAQRMEERRSLMQAWADYLDELRTMGTVLPFKGARKSDNRKAPLLRQGTPESSESVRSGPREH